VPLPPSASDILFAKAGIGGIVVHPPGPPGAAYLPSQALAGLDAEVCIALRGGIRFIAANQGAGAGFPECNKHPFAPTKLLRPGDHTLEHHIKVKGTAACGSCVKQTSIYARSRKTY
jgi:hypothetical protein